MNDIDVPQPELMTSRLLLRQFTLEDIARLAVLANDQEIAANTRSIPYPYSKEHAAEWIANTISNWNKGLGVGFAICCRQNNELMGAIGILIDSENERAELGYWVGCDFRGNGFCTEAGIALLDFGFASLGLNKICAHHFTRNPASGRVLEKLGLKQEGLAKSHVKKLELFEDIAFFGLTKSDWNSRD